MANKAVTLVCGLCLALVGFAADVIPTAYVSAAGRVITVEGKRVEPVVGYEINGADYTLDGKEDIPIVASGEVSGVVLRGEGTLTSLAGAFESGVRLIIR